MNGITDVIDLAQAGGIAILLVVTWQLWMRLNVVSDRFMTYLEKRDQMGDTAAQAVRHTAHKGANGGDDGGRHA